MLKNLVYFVVKQYMRLLKYIFFSRCEIVGMKNIPVGHPVIFSCNHQNAFMDALLVGGTSPIRMTSMTRSDVFGQHAGRWFMDALRMEPIYRIRDGINKLGRNEKVFEKVRKRLAANEGILIFSEGNHGKEYFLRPISKGSSRMALDAQDKMPEHEIRVVPVGVNYYHHRRPGHKVSIVFGEPIKVRDYLPGYRDHSGRGTNELKMAISDGMKSCLLIPEESPDYEEKKRLINRRNEHLPFLEMKEKLVNGELRPPGRFSPLILGIGNMLGIPNFLPLLLTRFALRPIKDVVFYGSVKWAASMFLFPLWFLIIFGTVSALWTWQIGLVSMLGAWTALTLRQLIVKLANPPH